MKKEALEKAGSRAAKLCNFLVHVKPKTDIEVRKHAIAVNAARVVQDYIAGLKDGDGT
jgi:hypothetical protein